MRQFRILFLFSMAAAMVMGGFTASAATVKIGVVDVQKILQQSKKARDIKGAFLMEIEAKRGVLRNEENQVRSLESKLKQFADSGSSEAQSEKEKLFEATKKLKRLRVDLEEELKKKDRTMTGKLLLQIRETVEAYRKKNKFTLIMEKKMLVAWDDEIDITDGVIGQFDSGK
ncbi:MAG: OmpH family outer membrane protein [Desulfobacterales bacterium]|nr:OmpH family outer membrane protein [Desulfobacterales bacterium]